MSIINHRQTILIGSGGGIKALLAGKIYPITREEGADRQVGSVG